MPHANWLQNVYKKPILTPALPGHDLFRADHLPNTKRGDVYIYYRNSLSLKLLNIQHSHEFINLEIRIGSKLGRFVSLYRSPSKSQDDLNHL